MRLPLPLICAACAVAAVPAPASAGVRRHEAERVLRRAEAVRAGRGVKTGFELTPLLKELATRLPDLAGGDRGRARRLMARPTPGNGQPGEDEYLVPEEPPLCGPHFCVHWVATTQDAPPQTDANGDGVPDFVAKVLDVSEHVHDVENGELGWREPVGDGPRGGDIDKTDVYLKELGDQGIFGYSTPDPLQKGNSQFAYLALDNDFAESEFPRYTDPVLPMEVTVAHEYNHVIQFGYDWLQDIWMFEATAVWAEDRVYDTVNDYRSYLPQWTRLIRTPLTTYDAIDPSDPVNVKVYGDAVWNRWIEAHYGQETIRGAWERSLSTTPRSFAPGAYDAALRARGTTFTAAFTRFAADTAEWRSSAGPFEEGSFWPDIRRGRTAKLNTSFTPILDHASYTLVSVPPTGDARIKLVVTLPAGIAGGIALVGRTGSQSGGALDVELKRLPTGGRARVELADPSRFNRITAVLVNAAVTQDGYHPEIGDWDFSRGDGQPVQALVSNDFAPPAVVARAPAAGKHGVARTAKVTVGFSEPVRNVTTRSLRLVGPGGNRIAATVSYDGGKRRAVLVPAKRLAAHRRYEVQLGPAVVDRGANAVPVDARTWHFDTGA